MEARRLVLAMALSLGVMILFMQVIIPWMSFREGPPGADAPVPAGGGGSAGGPVAAKPAPPPAPKPAAGVVATPPQAEKTVVIETPALRAELTSRGAALRRLQLKQYPTSVDDRTSLVLLDEFESGRLTFQVRDRNGAGLADLGTVNWELEPPADPTRAVFRYVREDGLVLRKTLGAGAGPHLLAGSLSVESRNAERRIQVLLELSGAAGICTEGGAYYISGIAGYEKRGGWVLRTGAGPSAAMQKPSEVPATDGTARLGWLGVADKYFAAVLVPDLSAWGGRIAFADYRGVVDSARFDAERARRAPLDAESLAGLREESAHSVAAVLTLAECPIDPGERREIAWRFYAGPKEPKTLAPYADDGLDVLVDYGFLSLRRVMLWLLLFFHALTGNYGVAIILLTFAVRLALFPISRKAQVSMFRMQKLAPQMKAIQEKFKDDPHRMRAEVMALYKKHQASPAGGCLPLLLQLPIFIGLYNTLLYSIELRQAPFALWIRDLSAPDHLCPLPFRILGQTELNLLPILMLVPMVVQTALSPKPADPQMAQQQKMMAWMMPLMFLFMCYTMPSGVSLYWFFSSLWGLVEIRLIKKLWLKDPPGADSGAPAPAVAAAGR